MRGSDPILRTRLHARSLQRPPCEDGCADLEAARFERPGAAGPPGGNALATSLLGGGGAQEAQQTSESNTCLKDA